MEVTLFENQLGNFVGNIFFDLLDEDNIKTLWEAGPSPRGGIAEELVRYQRYRNFENLNDVTENYPIIDFIERNNPFSKVMSSIITFNIFSLIIH